MEGRRALVTGASRGVGAAVARALAALGADLVLVARGGERLAAVADELTPLGVEVDVVAADVGTAAGVEAVLSAVGGRPVDVLVNNAFPSSLLVPEPDVLGIDPGSWRAAFEACVVGPYELVRGVAPGMRARGGGAVVNVVTSSVPVAGFAPAGVAKAGLWTLTRYLAVELAPEIRVNAVCPGTVGSAEEERAFARSDLLAQVPLARMGRPDEVAAAVVHLASSASSYTTGVLLPVTGGRPA